MSTFYIGWDVGGWNCDKNPSSRDALAILDSNLTFVGRPWRGNLRQTLNTSANSNGLIENIFRLCGDTCISNSACILAIDTPLGFSTELVTLLQFQGHVDSLECSEANPYLFRRTERYLFEHGLRPLSAIKDMIGSQATKGMHVVQKFAPKIKACGVWTDGDLLTVIEAYPSPCALSETVARLRSAFQNHDFHHSDMQDALTCAFIAYLFANRIDALAAPTDEISAREGWIWVPRDALAKSKERTAVAGD